jgi:predicted dehydrogenase
MFLDEMRHFLACLRGEERPLCTLEDGRAALEVALAARRAMTGAPGPDAADAAMLPATGVMT